MESSEDAASMQDSSIPMSRRRLLAKSRVTTEENSIAHQAAVAACSNDFCYVCQKPQRLMMCEQCPRAFHARCIDRFVDLENVNCMDAWTCPVCRGIDVLHNGTVSTLDEDVLAAKWKERLRENKKLRGIAYRRRDAFLSRHFDLIAPFASRPALTRIQKLKGDDLEIGEMVTATDYNGRQFEATVLGHDNGVLLVAGTQTGEEQALPRSHVKATGVRSDDKMQDYLGLVGAPVVAEGFGLKPWQYEGVNWLIHAFHNRCGGILGDDMGLGKTLQTLAFLSYLKATGIQGPFLIVVPLTCAANWTREIRRFTPHLTHSKLYGSAAEKEYSMQNNEIWYGYKDILVTTYETMVSAEEFFLRHTWTVTVLDEAHRIKSNQSNVRNSLDQIDTVARVLLTGTPLQNNLGELQALLAFLLPGILSKDSETFQSAVQLDNNEQKDETRGEGTVVDTTLVQTIRFLLQQLMLRREKKEVIRLPPKVLRDIWLPFSATQSEWYRTLLSTREEAAGTRALMMLVLRLRLTCDHPQSLVVRAKDQKQLSEFKTVNANDVKKLADAEIGPSMVKASGKLVFLDKLLKHLHAQNMGLCPRWRKACESRQKNEAKKKPKEWLQSTDSTLLLDEMTYWQDPEAVKKEEKTGDVDEDDDDTHRLHHPHKVLVFCQYMMVMDVLEKYCKWMGWRYLRLDGSTNRVIRELDMRDFNNPKEEYFVYLISTRAGGLGINLPAANHVVMYDQDWNPHVDSQAIDRAHRMGQYRSVNVYRLMQEWGVEERLIFRQQQKLQMQECVLVKDEEEEFEPEKLSFSELMAMLRHGEDALQDYQGVDLSNEELQKLLERQKRDLPPIRKQEPKAIEAQNGDDDDEIVVTEDPDGVASNDEVDDSEATASTTASTSPETSTNASSEAQEQVVLSEKARRWQKETEGLVLTTGRIRKATNKFVPQDFRTDKQKTCRPHFNHEKRCFICGEAETPDGEELHAQCASCPKAYHPSCLNGYAAAPPKNRSAWYCPWHACHVCHRKSGSCGGLLLQCLSCPSALCYDCFPSTFQRAHPPDQFFKDLNKAGWQITREKMINFQCNACRAFEEQQKRHKMKEEDLEAQQSAKKQSALMEKRKLAEVKKLNSEKAEQRKILDLLRNKKKWGMKADLNEALEGLNSAIASCWPPKLWAKIEEQKLGRPFTACSRCHLPCHMVKECMFPAERGGTEDSSKAEGTGEEKEKTPKFACPLCGKLGHTRIECRSLNSEQKNQYKERLEGIKRLTEEFDAMDPLPEPSSASSGDVAKARRETLIKVTDLVRATMQRCELGKWVGGEADKAAKKQAQEAKAQALAKRKIEAAAKAKAASIAKAKVKAEAKVKALTLKLEKTQAKVEAANVKKEKNEKKQLLLPFGRNQIASLADGKLKRTRSLKSENNGSPIPVADDPILIDEVDVVEDDEEDEEVQEAASSTKKASRGRKTKQRADASEVEPPSKKQKATSEIDEEEGHASPKKRKTVDAPPAQEQPTHVESVSSRGRVRMLKTSFLSMTQRRARTTPEAKPKEEVAEAKSPPKPSAGASHAHGREAITVAASPVKQASPVRRPTKLILAQTTAEGVSTKPEVHEIS
eukprot:gnl/MRDRNA2_/MRDRNA2_65790_c0_seq1.p1 gnl/MRDRNA2_/MRDRNA2_65790_c0~~gnl/MRDRNA2_/MRDRNA2_65790_c0_seq1.p1  ORF type:complete len:1597 (+),score=402.46 gnl/MRDRNA2_/MRDRNA2_65790_c0_seq1:75-4865(+)